MADQDDTPDDARLLAALAMTQSRGAIGERSLVDAVAHSDRFAALIPSAAASVVDLGSGGGLPGLVIAWRRPDLDVTMVERRTARADLLTRAVAALGIGGRTTVVADDVSSVARKHGRSFDVVTARSFADPMTTVGFVDQLLDDGGVALISEPPEDRSPMWDRAVVGYATLTNGGVDQGIRVLRRVKSRPEGST